MIVSDQVVTVLASSTIITFAVLIGILINDRQLSAIARNMDRRLESTGYRDRGPAQASPPALKR